MEQKEIKHCKPTFSREYNYCIKHKTNQVIQECMFRNYPVSMIPMKSFFKQKTQDGAIKWFLLSELLKWGEAKEMGRVQNWRHSFSGSCKCQLCTNVCWKMLICASRQVSGFISSKEASWNLWSFSIPTSNRVIAPHASSVCILCK